MINLINSFLFGPSGQEPESSPKASSGSADQVPQCLSDSFSRTTSILPDSVLGDSQSVRSKNISSRIVHDLAPMREAVYCLPSPLDDETCILLHDTLKILFNQTLGWVDEGCEGVSFKIGGSNNEVLVYCRMTL